MDLLGSDALQSEDDMHRMWGDSINAVQGKHARITYDDFLLLMKGQTKDPIPLEQKKLHSVPEQSMSADESNPDEDRVIVLPSGDKVNLDGKIEVRPCEIEGMSSEMNVTMNGSPQNLNHKQLLTPKKPTEKKCLLDIEAGLDSPLSMDDDDDLVQASGPGVPGSSASLTPPMTPTRGVQDFVTPSGQRRAFCDLKDLKNNLQLPGLPSSTGPALFPNPPPPYTRRRSRSVGDEDSPPEKPKAIDPGSRLSAVTEGVEVVKMILPETDHIHSINPDLDNALQDGSKTALVVNRKLYRAHRQMRLAVLEASKRFEEQQAEHAKELILAAREEDENETNNGMIQAGLVMRHGHIKQVSSQAIRTLLDSNRLQQEALVEKANKRGGRGRRSRKKTFSDMSGMLASMGSEDLSSTIARATAADALEDDDETRKMSLLYNDSTPATVVEDEALLDDVVKPFMSVVGTTEPFGGLVSSDHLAVSAAAHDLLAEQDGHLRSATVPGEFRKTSDPFGKAGRYGAAPAW